jgi:hemoglobin
MTPPLDVIESAARPSWSPRRIMTVIAVVALVAGLLFPIGSRHCDLEPRHRHLCGTRFRYRGSVATGLGRVHGKRLIRTVLGRATGGRTLWHSGHMKSVYEAAGGTDGMLRLAAAWHARVMADEVVGHAFSHGFNPQHTERLAAYWAEALGGPTTFSDAYGDETSVVRIHSGNGPHDEMDRRAIACFDQALEDVGLDPGAPVSRVLHDYFAWATTTTMSRYHESADQVPEGLPIPRWSWDGLQQSNIY